VLSGAGRPTGTYIIDFSTTSKARVWLGTSLGMLFCVGVAVAVDVTNFSTFTSEEIRRALTIDILLPSVLAGPLLYLLLSRIRALAIAHEAMAVMATTDSLTGILNRGAFTMLVEAYLAKAQQASSDSSGSLLVIDADYFKSINDRYGHAKRDEALRHIADSIQTALRPADLVGRVGGEEFAVFLPATSSAQAANVAERIRLAISELPFPGETERLLSVSIGGVNFYNEGRFDRLFQIADECLYIAKGGGRNQVSMSNYIGGAIA